MTKVNRLHKWLVFTSSCFVMILGIGFMFSIGVLFVDIMTVFNETRSRASLIQSVSVAVSMGSGVFVGPIIQRFGMVKTGLLGSVLMSFGLIISFFAVSVPYLIVSVGVVTGLGTICLFITSTAVVGHYFTERKALLLLSIVNAGSGIGGMIFPFILTYISETFGFRGTFLMSGGIVMNTIPAALLWTQPKHKISNNRRMNELRTEEPTDVIAENFSEVHRDLANTQEFGETITVQTVQDVTITEHNKSYVANIKSLLKMMHFIFFVLGMTFAYPSFIVLIIFVVDAFRDSGLTQSDANFGLLLMNAFGVGGRLLPGFMMQSKYTTALMVPTFSSFIAAISFTGFILVDSLPLKLVFCSLTGVPLGMFVSCFSVTPLDLVGTTLFGNAAGITLTATGLACVAAGPISGFIRDTTGSYVVVFLIASGIQIVSIALFLLLSIVRKIENHPLTEKLQYSILQECDPMYTIVYEKTSNKYLKDVCELL